VDQADFGLWQICYTGPAGGVPAGCACYDREPDGDIDSADFTKFNNCWTGPNVLYNDAKTYLTNCVPEYP
jgi:hypothetical protein